MIDILLAGSPNVGKTSLFNKMTKSFAHTGNWQGVTVDKLSKSVRLGEMKVRITDLPGLYSMTVYSPEEAVSRDQLIMQDGAAVINVCDASNLARNLYLTLQLLELGKNVVITVNMVDELSKKGKVFEGKRIEDALKTPVISVSAKYGRGIDELLKAAVKAAEENVAAGEKKYGGEQGLSTIEKLPYLKKLPVLEVWQIIKNNVAKADLPLAYAAVKVLENDEYILERLKLDIRQKRRIAALGDWQDRVASARYAFIDKIVKESIKDYDTFGMPQKCPKGHKSGDTFGCVPPFKTPPPGVPIKSKDFMGRERLTFRKSKQKGTPLEDSAIKKRNTQQPKLSRIDKVLLNKYLALPIFFLIMLLIFTITFYVPGRWLSNGLGFLIDKFVYAPVTTLLKSTSPWVGGLVGDGIIKGVGGVLVFLPQVTLLFLFLSILEDSGYISRVAFMTDSGFHKIGLSGRAAFTLLMGFGCSAAAVLSARALEDANMRKKTVLITPFMSCSARLPVYLLIVARFFGGNPLVVFALYIFGAAVAILFAAIFERTKRLKSADAPFVMEMPPYRLPSAKRAARLILHNTKSFLVRIGTMVLAFSVIIWILSNFSLANGFITGEGGAGGMLDNSVLSAVARFIAPIFKPLGFGSGEAAAALLSGLAAKEIILSSIEALGGVDVLFTGAYAWLCALSFLVFVLLYVPCFATLAAIGKEIGFGWAVFSFVLQTGVAYVGSLFTYTLGLLFVKHRILVFAALGVAFFIVVVVLLNRRILNRRKRITKAFENAK